MKSIINDDTPLYLVPLTISIIIPYLSNVFLRQKLLHGSPPFWCRIGEKEGVQRLLLVFQSMASERYIKTIQFYNSNNVFIDNTDCTKL